MKIRVMMLLGVALLVCGVSGVWGMSKARFDNKFTIKNSDSIKNRLSVRKNKETTAEPTTTVKDEETAVDGATIQAWKQGAKKTGADIFEWASNKKQAATDFKDYVRLRTGMMSAKEKKDFKKKQADKELEVLQRRKEVIQAEEDALKAGNTEIEKDFDEATDAAIFSLADARAAKKALDELEPSADSDSFEKQAYDMLAKSVDAKLKKAEQDAEVVNIKPDLVAEDDQLEKRQDEVLQNLATLEKEDKENPNQNKKKQIEDLKMTANQLRGEIIIRKNMKKQENAAKEEMKKSLKNYTNLVKVGTRSAGVIFVPVTLAVAGGMTLKKKYDRDGTILPGSVQKGIQYLKNNFPEIKKPGLTNLRVQVASFGDRVKESKQTLQDDVRAMRRVHAETQQVRSDENIIKHAEALRAIEEAIYKNMGISNPVRNYANMSLKDLDDLQENLPKELGNNVAFLTEIKKLASAVKIKEKSTKKLADLQKKVEDEANKASIEKGSEKDIAKTKDEIEEDLKNINTNMRSMQTAIDYNSINTNLDLLKKAANQMGDKDLTNSIDLSIAALEVNRNKLPENVRQEIIDEESEIAESTDQAGTLASMVVNAGKKVMSVPATLVSQLRGKSKDQVEEGAEVERTADEAGATRGEDDVSKVNRTPSTGSFRLLSLPTLSLKKKKGSAKEEDPIFEQPKTEAEILNLKGTDFTDVSQESMPEGQTTTPSQEGSSPNVPFSSGGASFTNSQNQKPLPLPPSLRVSYGP